MLLPVGMSLSKAEREIVREILNVQVTSSQISIPFWSPFTQSRNTLCKSLIYASQGGRHLSGVKIQYINNKRY